MIPLWFSINWNVLDLTCWAIAWSSLFLERNMDITHPNVKYLHKMTFMPVSNMLTKLTSSWIPRIANHEQKQLKTEKINLVSFDINFYACLSVMSCDPIWNKGFWYNCAFIGNHIFSFLWLTLGRSHQLLQIVLVILLLRYFVPIFVVVGISGFFWRLILVPLFACLR